VLHPCSDAASVGGAAQKPRTPPSLRPRPIPPKPAHTPLPPQRSNVISVRFADGTGARLQGSTFTGTTGKSMQSVNRTLAAAHGITISPLYDGAPDQLQAQREQRQRQSGRELADKSLAFKITTSDPAQAQALIDALNQDPLIELAYMPPVPANPALAPGDYTGQQGYKSPASANGIDVAAVASLPGGTGQGVRIIDLENGWDLHHVDLSKAALALIGTIQSSKLDDQNHGTAVLGELVGDSNAYGVTGIAPDATLGLVSWAFPGTGGTPSQAIALAAQNLDPTETQGPPVMLLEGQLGCKQVPAHPCPYAGTDGDFELPMEWDFESHNAIADATAAGIIVIEAAGNGGHNLDDPLFGGWFSADTGFDTGAIMVGGGAPSNGYCWPQNGSLCGQTFSARERLPFSNFRQCVDVQGWGASVVMTGYGDLYPTGCSELSAGFAGCTGAAPDTALVDAFYTSYFDGTSSASPIVAGGGCPARERRVSQDANAHSPGSPAPDPAGDRDGPDRGQCLERTNRATAKPQGGAAANHRRGLHRRARA
jgi:serine protease